MAEAIGLAASVAGLASLGATVSIGLYQVCHTMKHASDQISDMARDISLFASVLEQLSTVLETQESRLRPTSLHLIKNVVDTTESIFDQVNPTIKPDKTTAKARFLWVVNKPKALELKTKIESLKSTLTVLLQTVALDTYLGEARTEYVQAPVRYVDSALTLQQEREARKTREGSAPSKHPKSSGSRKSHRHQEASQSRGG